ncbi:DNA polymerase III subunit delta' [Sporomusa sp.]|uniref:DNA polymerase III subunit delta' n=1 Tax=Sporomusa sp. TaxID=2078658 RepID=UPI002C881F4F|nr:DNA polymerase III subunit delta' [Sporomusa sp.]HWR42870.1 DNA polymerase III subunit delta' [Sporomusa sp.]
MMINWDEIIGHKDAVRILRTMLFADKMTHALLFAGPAGIGKSLAGKLLAAGILCSGSSTKPCGHCQACIMYSRAAHPDFTLVRPDGRAIKIDQIRALQHFAALAPAAGLRRVCLIEDAELMTVQAANSLLKLLEEPPPGFVFILVAGTAQPLLPTILSRCRKIQFQPLAAGTLAQALVVKGYAPEAANVAARLSGGRMGAALGLLAPEGLAARNTAAELLDSLQDNGMEAVWDKALKLDSLEPKEVVVILEFLIYLLRDVVLIAGRHSEHLLYNIDYVPKLNSWADNWSEGQSISAISAVKNTIRAISGNANTRLAVEALLINLKDLAEKGD